MGNNTQKPPVAQETIRVRPPDKDIFNSEPSHASALNGAEQTTTNGAEQTTQKLPKPSVRILPQAAAWRESKSMRVLEEQCRHFCLSTFFRQHDPIHSLGITSSIAGEGKSLIAIGMAQVLAQDSTTQVTLLECNWNHKSLRQYFALPKGPGLAEWLRAECQEEAIRYRVSSNLTIIPAGESKQDEIKLLQRLQQQGIQKVRENTSDFLIVDLPSIVVTAYGSFAASLLEALVIVVRAGVTPTPLLEETNLRLKGMPVEGLILNQVQSKTPRWIRRII